MRYSSRLDCLIILHQELSVYVKDKAAKGGAKHPLHILEARYYPSIMPLSSACSAMSLSSSSLYVVVTPHRYTRIVDIGDHP